MYDTTFSVSILLSFFSIRYVYGRGKKDVHSQKLHLNKEIKTIFWSRSSNVKTDLLCLFRNLRGPTPRHPAV